MAINVKSYLTLRQVMEGKPSIEMDIGPVTIHELLQALVERFGPGFREMVFVKGSLTPGPDVRILVNGRHYGTLSDGLDTVLRSGDEVGLFPPIAGG